MDDLSFLSKNVEINGDDDEVDGPTVQILASGLGGFDTVQEVCLTPEDATKLAQALLDAVHALSQNETYEKEIN